ncbi:MAG TPA: hypothetical protein VF743_02770 [Acidimicrobiales bacterium]
MEEDDAKRYAGGVALVVFALALVVVVLPGLRELSLEDGVYERRMVTEVVRTEGPDGTEVRTTTKPSDDSTLERALGDGGLLLVRLGVAVAAAFLAGAVTIRILLGRYGFKAAGVELDDVTGEAAEKTAVVLAALETEIDTHRQASADALRTAAEALRLAAETTRRVEVLEAASAPPGE